MPKTIIFKYWFIHDNNSGNIFEDEKGNWIVVFDGKVKLGQPFYVHDANGITVSAEEIGLLEILRFFIVERIIT